MNLRHLVFVALLMAAGAFAFQDGKQSKQQSHGKSKSAVKRKKDVTKPQSSRRRSDDPPPVGDPGPWPINPPKAAAGAPLAQNGPKGPWPISPPQPRPTFVTRSAPDGTAIFYDVFAEFSFNQPITQDSTYIVLYRLRNGAGGDPEDYTLAGNRFTYMSVRKGAKKAKVYIGTTTQSPSVHDKNCRFCLTFLPVAGAKPVSGGGLGPFGPWPISPPASRANWQHVGTEWRLYGEINLTGMFSSPPGGVLFTISPRAVLPVGTSTVLPTPMPPVTFRWTQGGLKQDVLLLTLNTPPTSQDETRMIEY